MGVLEKVETMLRAEPEVRDTIGVVGFSVFYRYANQGFVYVTLKDWKERKGADQHVLALIHRMNGKFAAITEARVFAMNEPPISGMGSIAGFDYRLLALDGDRTKLDKTAAELVAAARADPTLAAVRSVAAPEVQTLFLDVDRNKAKTLRHPARRRLPDDRHAARLVVRQPVHRVRHQPEGQAAVGAAVPLRPGVPAALLRAQRQGRHGAARRRRGGGFPLGADRAQPLQRLSGGAGERHGGAGLQLGPGARRDGADLGRGAAAGA